MVNPLFAGVQIEEPFAVLALDAYCGVCERSVQQLMNQRHGKHNLCLILAVACMTSKAINKRPGSGILVADPMQNLVATIIATHSGGLCTSKVAGKDSVWKVKKCRLYKQLLILSKQQSSYAIADIRHTTHRKVLTHMTACLML